MDTQMIVSGLLKIIHPGQYKAGEKAQEQLRKIQLEPVATFLKVEELWKTPFTGISLISNRETTLHRDTQGELPWYDILLTVGDYSEGRMEVPGVGIRLAYNSGTFVAIAGKVLAHGVAKVERNRFCFAHFMRSKVVKRLNSGNVDWVTTNVIEDYWGKVTSSTDL